MTPATQSGSGTELIGVIVDPGSFRVWDSIAFDPLASGECATALQNARLRSGTSESVTTGEGTINGHRVAIAVSEFGFLGGSMGIQAASRLVTAIERATRERLPLLASPCSGGTRMQEGTAAFVGMVAIAAALAAHRQSGLPYLVYLRHPTTGGVMASWGSLGHITVAQPGALLGFLGPRVYETLRGVPFPEGVQTAENLFRHGIIDGIVRPEALRDLISRVLAMLLDPPDDRPIRPLSAVAPDGASAWESIQRSRKVARPGVLDVLRIAARDAVPLSGTGAGERESGMVLALARFGGRPCVIVGQDRHSQRRIPLGPAGLREAQRGARLARELRLPLVAVIDTPGGLMSRDAEEGALASEIARTLADLMTHDGITISLILGEGTGGLALALLPADRSYVAQHGWLAPLPPEGASAIVHRDASHARELAEAQGVRSADLLAGGIVNAIIPERTDASDEPAEFCHRVGKAIEIAIRELETEPAAARLARRSYRYRRLLA